MPEFDLFNFFRTTLFVFVGTYSGLMMISGLWRLTRFLGGADPHKQILRDYLTYLLLSVRTRTIRGDLIEIAALAAALVGIWRLHDLI
jgi:hypothetical protein